MIPALLEKAILKGWANYSKYTHAMGMFGGMKIPENKIVIIVDIKWHNFINPYTNSGTITIREFFKYNEYQLKIDGKKSVNTLTFRNTLHIEKTAYNAAFDVNYAASVLTLLVPSFAGLAPDPPIQQDVYFVCEKFIKLTISRNCFFNTLTSNYGLLASPSNEKNAPSGVKNIKLLKQLTMASVQPQTQYYSPPNNEDSGLAIPGGRNHENYDTDIEPVDVLGNSNSEIYAPDTGFTATFGQPTITQPLVELGIVTINSNHFDELQSL